MNRRERRAAKAKTRSVKEAYRCPCGGTIVRDDATLTIRHTKPQCTLFKEGMVACGMKPFSEQWAEVINPITGELVEKGSA